MPQRKCKFAKPIDYFLVLELFGARGSLQRIVRNVAKERFTAAQATT